MTIPAIAGGKPARGEMLPFTLPFIDHEDMNSVVQSLKGDVLSMGGRVREFERAFASYTGSKYAVAVSSGAAGMHIALMAGGIGPQEEVIASPLTHPASTNCILYQKAVPVFTDISTTTLTLDPEKVKYRMTGRTRAIIISHYGGFPCDLDRLAEIAGEAGLLIIEDSTLALGARYRGRMIGTFGDMGVFSFSSLNGVTTGEGGMVVTDSEETCQWLSMFRDNGMVRERERLTKQPGPWHRAEMQDLGYNYRMTEMQAALGLSQIGKADAFLRRRTEIAEKYSRTFQKFDSIVLPRPVDGASPSWSIYPVRIRPDRLSTGHRVIFEAILKENVGVDILYLPVHVQPYYLWIGHPDVCTLEGSLCPEAEEAYENLICLPVYPSMSNQDTEDVISAVTKVLNYYSLK